MFFKRIGLFSGFRAAQSQVNAQDFRRGYV
jgi:hypothetical protein